MKAPSWNEIDEVDINTDSLDGKALTNAYANVDAFDNADCYCHR